MTDTDRALERLRSANPLPGIDHADADELGLFVSYFEERVAMPDTKTVQRGSAADRPRRIRPALVLATALVGCLVVVGAVTVLTRGEKTSVEPAATVTAPPEATTVVETPSLRWAETKLVASDGTPNDWFGYAVDVDEDRIVIGAPTRGGQFTGAVYVYERDGDGGWLETKLRPSGDDVGGQFGMSVSADGGRIVVGRPFERDSHGSAYVFELDSSGTWVETRLTASDGAADDEFGASVAVDGDRIVIGAGGHAEGSGMVYVFELNQDGAWVETKVAAPDADSVRDFGSIASYERGVPVAVDGDRMVAGAYLPTNRSTAVYVFEVNGDGEWFEIMSTEIGTGAAVDGDRIVVRVESGVVVYQPAGDTGWVETPLQTNEPSYRLAAGEGRIVITTDPIAVEGTEEEYPVFREETPLYVFEPEADGGWTETKLTSAWPITDTDYGAAVATDGDAIVVGAPFSHRNFSTYPGAVYLYERDRASR